jgi:hypothetical protein
MVIQPRAAGVGGVYAPTKRASESGSLMSRKLLAVKDLFNGTAISTSYVALSFS